MIAIMENATLVIINRENRLEQFWNYSFSSVASLEKPFHLNRKYSLWNPVAQKNGKLGSSWTGDIQIMPYIIYSYLHTFFQCMPVAISLLFCHSFRQKYNLNVTNAAQDLMRELTAILGYFRLRIKNTEAHSQPQNIRSVLTPKESYT